MTAGLLDTSVFIAHQSGRVIAKLPERVALSVITIGELQLGVLTAGDADCRAAGVHRAVKFTDSVQVSLCPPDGPIDGITTNGDVETCCCET